MLPPFSAFVLYAFIWFLTLLVVLPLRMKTQGEAGEVVVGTPQSAPANLNMRRKVIITTIAATIIWALVAWIILSGTVTLEDIDIVHRWLDAPDLTN